MVLHLKVKTLRFLSILGITLLISTSSLLSHTPSAYAASSIYCVSTSSVITHSPCINKTTYVSIQDAVDAASTDDEIRIAIGTYTAGDQSRVVYIRNKSLKLRGGYTDTNWIYPTGSGATIIDGQQQHGGIEAFDHNQVTLERMTITRAGSATGGGVQANGNALSVITLIDVVISNNTATNGGGMFVGGGTGILIRSQLIDNKVNESGGGFYGFNIRAIDSIIARNTAMLHAGGVSANNISIDRSSIVENTAMNGEGGGIYAGGGTLAMTRTHVLSNTAGIRGGGIYLESNRQANISWSLISNNDAPDGAALHTGTPSLSLPNHVYLQNVTIAHSGVSSRNAITLGRYIPSQPMNLTLNNVVVANYAVGIKRQTTTTIDGNYNAFSNNGTNQVVDDTVVPLPFTHLITTELQFRNPANGDFHGRSESPLRDAGNPALDYRDQRDLDGIPVPIDARIDIGAYEYIEVQHVVYLPLGVR